jgi:AraC-like DNA-binding protein
MDGHTSSYVCGAMVASLVGALGDRARGLGLERLAGVDSLQRLLDPTTRLQNGCDDAIFAQTARALRMPHLGLWFGTEVADERAFGALGYLARHAPTLSEALERVARYGALFTSGEATEIHVGPKTFRIVEGARSARDWSPVMGDAVMATWLTLLQRCTRSTMAPISAWFATPRPANDTHHQALFGVSIRFDADVYALELPNEVLGLPFVDTDLVLGATLERQAQELLGLGAHESALLRDVHRALEAGQLDLLAVASTLAMHPRTLQRQLDHLGVTWSVIRDRQRRCIAERLLTQRGISLKVVAAAAGFADVTSFRRAFKRWTGHLPRTRTRE